MVQNHRPNAAYFVTADGKEDWWEPRGPLTERRPEVQQRPIRPAISEESKEDDVQLPEWQGRTELAQEVQDCALGCEFTLLTPKMLISRDWRIS